MWPSREERREGERRESVKNGTRQSHIKNPKEKENTALTGSDMPRILISQAIRASDSSEKTNGKKTMVYAYSSTFGRIQKHTRLSREGIESDNEYTQREREKGKGERGRDR